MRLLLLLSAGFLVFAATYRPGPAPLRPEQARGVWLAETGGAPIDGPAGAAALRKIRDLGANAVAFGPEVHMPHHRRPELAFGERDASLRDAIRLARAAGLDVLLLPRIESPEFFRDDVDPKPWRGDVEMTSPQDGAAFYENYGRMLAHYGALAREEGCRWFCIGLEYRRLVKAHPSEWRRLAAVARRAFRGPITYSANWDDYRDISWWDAVDLVGIGAYFELAPAPPADDARLAVGDLVRGWRPIRRELEAFAAATGRPVLFTEVGYPAFADAGYRPWEWQRPDKRLDARAQADAWRALFRTFSDEPWWAGVFAWRFYTDPTSLPAWDYAFEGKEAEHVLRSAFAPR
ncbi:MAG TPA: hypothetical protein VEI02_13770 [Planctomycetota bacterium]|nr:hypothetical protein [Planctomycetota bacterium]